MSISDYTQRARQFKRDEFWKQVRRTIDGQEVSDDQIQLIVDQINNGLKVEDNDRLVDIGCGNGALTKLVATKKCLVYGIDPSHYLIEIAKEFFQNEKQTYEVGYANDDSTFTELRLSNKCLIYGVSSYLEDEMVAEILCEFFTSTQKIMFIGAVRDLEHRTNFYTAKNLKIPPNTSDTTMGIWRQKRFFYELARKNNLDIKILKMPKAFYASEYYYDVVLTS